MGSSSHENDAGHPGRDLPSRKGPRSRTKSPAAPACYDALAEKLEGESPARQKARTKLAGRLRHLRKETDRISKLIDREFERVEPEEWV